MSTPISANVPDLRLEDIRKTVATKTGTIPFFLMPVRIETRFMEVEKKELTNDVSIAPLLNFFMQIQVQVIDLLHKTGQVNIAEINLLNTDIKTLIFAISKVEMAQIKEKSWLLILHGELAEDTLAVLNKNSINKATTQANLDELKEKINAIKVNKEGRTPDVQLFLEAIKKIEAKIVGFSTPRKTPFINLKNKKDLYNYTANSLAEALEFYNSAPQKIVLITEIFKNQTTNIAQIHQNIVGHTNTLAINLGKIHADEHWKQFVNNTSTTIINELIVAQRAFHAKVIAKLMALPQPISHFDERDFHFHGIQTFTHLKKYNSAGQPAKYLAVKAIQDKLAPRISTLSNNLQPNFLVSDARTPFVKKVYDEIQAQLTLSKTKVGTYNPINNSQQKGVNIIQDFLAAKAQGTIGKVIERVVIPAPMLNQKVNELWVRIYPDDIFVQTHEPELTENEVVDGKNFWKNWWASTNNNELELASFRSLAASAGIRRAAWIVRSLDPRKVATVKNTKSLKIKPSQKINEATKILEDTHLKLQPFYTNIIDKSPEVVIAAIEPLVFSPQVTKLKEAFTKLKTVKFELNFSVQNLQTAIMRLSTGLNLLIDKRNNLPAAMGNVFQAKLDVFEKLVAQFNLIVQHARLIEPLPFDLFVKKLAEPFDYQSVVIKVEAWSKAPHTTALPDRFVVITKQNNVYSHTIVGKNIPANLQLGLNPANPDESVFHMDANGDLRIDEKLLWMTEYSEAEKRGMAITVPITKQQAEAGFDQVFVLGIKDTDANLGQQQLTNLFQNHIYAPDGMAFLKVATPTNNTHQDSAGFKPDNDLEKIFNIELKQPAAPRKFIGDTDSSRLKTFLGFANNELGNAVGCQNTQISDAIVMNRAMWNGTLGHYMEEMWDGVFTYDNIQRTECFFIENILGRGFLPSIRIGEQPYGILPTTAFSKLQLFANETFPKLSLNELKTLSPAVLEPRLQKRFDLRLLNILQSFQNIWRNNTVMHADILNNGEGTDTYQKRYMNMLGLHATSLNYNVRYGVNVGKGPQLDPADQNSVATNFSEKDAFGPYNFYGLFKELMYEGVFSPSFYYGSEESPLPLKFKNDDDRYNQIFNSINSSRIFISRFLNQHPELRGQTVDQFLPTNKLLSNDYIKWLLESHPNAILGSNKWANLPDKSLLFMLLRQSIMQAYQEAALSILQTENTISETNRRSLGASSEYLTYDYDASKRSYSTKWHYLMKNLKDLKGQTRLNVAANPFYTYMASQIPSNSAMNAYVFTKKPSMLQNPLFLNYPQRAKHQKYLEKVDDVRAAIATLGTIPTKELEVLMAEHLDLCSYRLDAWQLGFVNKRLKQQRIINQQGLYLGAFGWVENLRPDTNRQLKSNGTIPAELNQTGNKVYEDPDNQGFIHAPSIHHGVAAAILRAGYLADKKKTGGGSRLSVNLTSERVRMALGIISGLQNGLDLGAILGFQFERGLHERYNLGVELDKYIQPLRKLYPLVEEIAETADGKTPEYQTNVIHGLRLLEDINKAVDWFNNNTEKTLEILLIENNFANCPAFIKNLTANVNERIAIIKEIDRIADSLDALGDLVLSEGVYQIVKGNHVRAAAALASISPNQKTATNIPIPEIIDTPRTGTIVTQRVLFSLPLKNAFEVPTQWASAPKSIRAEAEPAINFWLATLLGDHKSIGCEVLIKPKTGNQQQFFVNLKYLNWQPIDYFYYAADEALLCKKIIWQVRKNEVLADDSLVVVNLKGKLGGRSFYEMDWVINHIRTIFNGAKYAGDSDALSADQKPASDLNAGAFDATQYLNRVKLARKSLNDTTILVEGMAKIKAVLNGTDFVEKLELTNTEINKIHDILEKLTCFGIDHLIPEVIQPVDSQKNALIRQLITGYKDAKKRLTEASSIIDSFTANTAPQVIVEKSNEAFKIIFNKGFLALPQFKLTNHISIANQNTKAFDKTEGILRHNNNMAMEKWLQSIAKVREKMYAVEMLSSAADSLNTLNINILPSQLPYNLNEYWLGAEYPESHQPVGDKLSVVVVQPENLAATSVGILVDDWVEIIPNKTETTGLTFHYNQPNAMPPQSILLAVNPEDSPTWTWDNLVYTLEDTLALAKQRAIEPDMLQKGPVAQILPAIVAEVAPGSVADADGNPLGVQVALDFIENNKKKQ